MQPEASEFDRIGPRFPGLAEPGQEYQKSEKRKDKVVSRSGRHGWPEAGAYTLRDGTWSASTNEFFLPIQVSREEHTEGIFAVTSLQALYMKIGREEMMHLSAWSTPQQRAFHKAGNQQGSYTFNVYRNGLTAVYITQKE